MKPHRFGTKSDVAAQRGWLPVQPDLETLRAQAYAQGMADGAANTRPGGWQEAFDAGRADGEQAAEARLQASYAERLRDELDAMELPLAALQAAREQVHARLAAGAVDVLSDVASRAVRAVVQRELHTAPADIAGIVQRLLTQFGAGDDAVTVHVSPADAQVLCARVGSTSAHADDTRPGWRIVADPSLVRGDCRVDVDGLWYDAGCDGREAAAQTIARKRLSEWVEACVQASASAETSETR
ncbi:flagellar assembly protein H [Pandoraea horticolens]|uniref:Flagellar assembly protein FliH n=1 Tax=Pandoraea horticolens TaxID=2508298 RepID=A0A5E4S809_9BURK|nr:FliH/SctL family protein [Pandoraea horticolens]VVD71213.1 flagellar assembly protein H [Pandoraea horticolens]